MSVAAIAGAAGVDRRTVYRRFPNRDALLCAVFQAKLDAIDDVLAQSRMAEAPVAWSCTGSSRALSTCPSLPGGNEQMGCRRRP